MVFSIFQGASSLLGSLKLVFYIFLSAFMILSVFFVNDNPQAMPLAMCIKSESKEVIDYITEVEVAAMKTKLPFAFKRSRCSFKFSILFFWITSFFYFCDFFSGISIEFLKLFISLFSCCNPSSTVVIGSNGADGHNNVADVYRSIKSFLFF